MPKTAKVFMTGRSQAVRLPAEFRFEAAEVFIHRDEKSGDVILSRSPASWKDIFDLFDKAGAPKDFLSKKQRDMRPPPDRVKF